MFDFAGAAKWIAISVAVSAAAGAVLSVKGCVEDQNNKVVQEVSDKMQAQADAAAEKSARQVTEATLKTVEAQKTASDALLTAANAENQALRVQREQQKMVFEKHDLGALMAKKPGLIERLANKATAERMQQFEEAINGVDP